MSAVASSLTGPGTGPQTEILNREQKSPIPLVPAALPLLALGPLHRGANKVNTQLALVT